MFETRDSPEIDEELIVLSDQLIEKQAQLSKLKLLLNQLTILGQLKYDLDLISLQIESTYDLNSSQDGIYKFKLSLNYSKLTELEPCYWSILVKLSSNETNNKHVGWIKSYPLTFPTQLIFISLKVDTFKHLRPPFLFQLELKVSSALDNVKTVTALIKLKPRQVSFLAFLTLPSLSTSTTHHDLTSSSLLTIFEKTCELLCYFKSEDNLCHQFLKFLLPSKFESFIKQIDNNCACIDLLFSNNPIRLTATKPNDCKFVEVKIESNLLSLVSLTRISIISLIKVLNIKKNQIFVFLLFLFHLQSGSRLLFYFKC